MTCCCPYRSMLLRDVAMRLEATGARQGLTHPLGKGHMTRARCTLNVAVFGILQNHL